MIPFLIGKYFIEVICNAVPMKAGNLLLGRPWQHEKRVTHDGYKNRYSFVFKGQNFTLVALSPTEAREDQLKFLKTLEGQ